MRDERKSSNRRYRQQRLQCEERERLEKAYQDALRKRDAIEVQLDQELVSGERRRTGRARNQREDALGHAIHIQKELMAHERKHGCVRRTLDNAAPTIEND